jgi:hypothetical protein
MTVGVGVCMTMVMAVVVGMRMSHVVMLYYNITGVHRVTRHAPFAASVSKLGPLVFGKIVPYLFYGHYFRNII